MGKAIEDVAIRRGHEIVLRVSASNRHEMTTDSLRKADVAIEFSTPETAVPNIQKCLEANIPVVIGTTGWYNDLELVRKECESRRGTILYASNFSIGVNIFFAINTKLASLMNGQPQYNVTIEETHHVHKKDAPSGTALSLAGQIIGELDRKNSWMLTGKSSAKEDQIAITSYREDEVPGTHIINYRSEQDEITLKHTAFGREGFAFGAVLASEWLKGRVGVFGMNDVLKI